MRELLRLLAIAILLCALGDSALAARRVALVVGNQDYQTLTDLKNPENDAEDMAALLRELGFDLVGGEAHLNISRRDFSSLVLEFGAALGNGDVGLFYYAGHGAAYDGHNYLIPVNDDGLQYREQVPDFGFDAQRVLSAMRGRSAGTNLIILDACRDNPLPGRVAGRDLGKNRGLVPMTGSAGGGRNDLFIYAAEPGQIALDGSGRNGVFTGALLSALRQPNREINQVLQLTAQEVGAKFPGVQDAPLPWWEGRLTEALVLNGQQRDPVIPAPTPSAPDPVPARESTALLPQMVTIPSGDFVMGSPESEDGRSADEGPQTTIAVTSFRLAKYEVTVGEFRRFVDATGYRTDAEKNIDVPDHLHFSYEGPNPGCWGQPRGASAVLWSSTLSWRDPGFDQGGDHPVVCVSWRDTQAYIEWLNRETGKLYRLPSEAEQEYAIRAGSRSPYAWGTDVNQACTHGNVKDSQWTGGVSCADGATYTTGVGRYAANAFGVYDTIGNAWEWGQDCYQAYPGGSRGNSAIEVPNCELRVLRGKAWSGGPFGLRSAFRYWSTPVDRDYITGFRLAEDL